MTDGIKQEVKEYLTNRDKRIMLNGDLDVKNTVANGKIDDIKERYSNMISKIEEEKEGLINDVKQDKGQYVEQKKKEIDNLEHPIEEVERKIKFLELAKKIKKTDVSIDDSEMGVYGTGKLYRKGFFFKDKYMIIKIYIAENSKPVNKHTLFACGNCVFGNFMALPYGYGLPVYSDRGNIKTVIKELPTIEDINAYLKKNRDRILKNLIDTYNSVKKEYLDIIKGYRLSDFKTVLEVRSIPENDAPLVCMIDKTSYLRIYRGFYYWSVKKIEGNDVFEYIKVNGKLYKRDCRKEVMSIREYNLYGDDDWWSMDIECHHLNKSNRVFNKKNYDRILEERKNIIKGKNKNRVTKIHFTYPKVKWVNPDVIDKVGD